MEAIFANIQNALIFRILVVFESGFLHRITILTQSDDFAKSLSPIFDMFLAILWACFSFLYVFGNFKDPK